MFNKLEHIQEMYRQFWKKIYKPMEFDPAALEIARQVLRFDAPEYVGE